MILEWVHFKYFKHVHKGTIENAYTILNGEYEVIEADILETSELINKELKNADLPDEIRVGAILKNKFILPSSIHISKRWHRRLLAKINYLWLKIYLELARSN